MTFEKLKQKALIEQDITAKIMYAVALCEGVFNGETVEKNIESGKKILFDLGEQGDVNAIMYYAMTLLQLNLEPAKNIIDYLAPRCEKISDSLSQAGAKMILADLYIIDHQDELGVKILKEINLPHSWNVLADYYLGLFNDFVISEAKHKERKDFTDIIDIENGKYYLEKAIAQKHRRSYLLKGICLLKGTLGYLNDNEAYKFLNLAYSAGEEESAFYLKQFKKKFFGGWTYKGTR